MPDLMSDVVQDHPSVHGNKATGISSEFRAPGLLVQCPESSELSKMMRRGGRGSMFGRIGSVSQPVSHVGSVGPRPSSWQVAWHRHRNAVLLGIVLMSGSWPDGGGRAVESSARCTNTRTGFKAEDSYSRKWGLPWSLHLRGGMTLCTSFEFHSCWHTSV